MVGFPKSGHIFHSSTCVICAVIKCRVHLEITLSLRFFPSRSLLQGSGDFNKLKTAMHTLTINITVIDFNAFDCSDNNHVIDMTNMMNIL